MQANWNIELSQQQRDMNRRVTRLNLALLDLGLGERVFALEVDPLSNTSQIVLRQELSYIEALLRVLEAATPGTVDMSPGPGQASLFDL